MKLVKIMFFLIVILDSNIHAQTHWVIFTDKQNVEFNPYEYFDPKAIERRISIGYDLYDISDYPVNSEYIRIVTEFADSASYESRWMNAISIWASDKQIETIGSFPFVREIIPIQQNYYLSRYDDDSDIALDTVLMRKQLDVMQGELFHSRGIDGSGVRIAVFDGGFPKVDTHPAFEHIRSNNRIIKTYDFVRKREFVYAYNSHGTSVLSVIAGIYNGQKMGLATGAEFLLARTEKNSEPFSEEVNWVAALEWADKNGADIVNSSLGYTYHRYFPYQMDGNTAFVSKMANTAASKGILVVNAAGNEGSGKWKIIGAPADAEDILTVGGIDPDKDYKINFSSIGPTTDLRRKPDVCAYGKATVANKKSISTAFGTSFASPLVTGFAACVKQIYPQAHPLLLKKFIQQSGHLYPHYDYGHGYGVPQASKILFPDSEQPTKTFDVFIEEENIKIQILPDILNDDEKTYEYHYNHYLFYSWLNEQNVILEWGIYHVYEPEFYISKKMHKPASLSLHFRGYTQIIDLQK